MNKIFEDCKDLYDMWLTQFTYPKAALQTFAKDVGIEYAFACIIHFILETNKSLIPYNHMWITQYGAILWTETSSGVYIAKWITPDGEYSDYRNGICGGNGDIINDIEFCDNVFGDLNKDELTALKLLVEALGLNIEIH